MNSTKSDGCPDQQRKQTNELILPLEVSEKLPPSNGKTGFKPSLHDNNPVNILGDAKMKNLVNPLIKPLPMAVGLVCSARLQL
jgi:hypothetical protein